MITENDYLFFAERALDGMADIVRNLGDQRANVQVPLPGANSPYALLNHCLGVIDAWVGGFVCGRPFLRDRDAEFEAAGEVGPLLDRVNRTRQALREDVAAANPSEPLAQEPPASFEGPPRKMTQGAALQHVYEELAQHRGQMEILRDMIVSAHVTSATADS